jgi:hypothetical protein
MNGYIIHFRFEGFNLSHPGRVYFKQHAVSIPANVEGSISNWLRHLANSIFLASGIILNKPLLFQQAAQRRLAAQA